MKQQEKLYFTSMYQEECSIPKSSILGNEFQNHIDQIGLTNYSRVNAAGKPYDEDRFLIL